MDESWKRSEKRKQIDKHVAGLAHQKSREDRRILKEKARRRRAASERRGPRRRDWRDGDENGALESLESFERIRPSERYLTRDKGAAQRRAAASADASNVNRMYDALVVRVDRGRARVRLPTGEERDAPLAPGLLATAPGGIAVGDEVCLDEVERVADVAPRRGALARPDPGDRHVLRVIVANVDVVCVVASVARPATRPGLVDRLLVAAARGGAEPVLVTTKIDLLEAAGRAVLDERLSARLATGVPGFAVSTTTHEGIAALAGALGARTAVLVGHSGVGKSSLLNALDPRAAQPTGDVRASDGRGRHTTTAAVLWELPGGGRVIDTPGVREFGLGAVNREELDAAFPDVAAHATGCRFGDCAHGPEPDCAVRSAVAAGTLPRERLAAWHRIRDHP